MNRQQTSTGELTGVGLGPGDPGLMTFKALAYLETCDSIICPRGKRSNRSVARDIIGNYLPNDPRIEEFVFPMAKDTSARDAAYESLAGHIAAKIDLGKRVAFVTIGDPGIYSTFVYLEAAFRAVSPGYRVQTIPGVSSIQLSASLLSSSLAQWDERFAVLPLPAHLDELEAIFELFDTVVIMKIGNRFRELHAFLQSRNLLESAGFVSHAGLPDELVRPRLSRDDSELPGYLSTVVIRKRSTT